MTVERDRGITLWDVASLKVARTWMTATGYWGADPRAALDSSGTLLACGCAQGPIRRLWDMADGHEIAQLTGHDGCSIDVAFSPDGKRLASAGQDHSVRLWDIAARTCVAVLSGHNDSVWRVAFSGDGKLLASGSGDNTIRFWDARTGAALGVASAGSKVYGLAFNPDNTRLAAGCADNTVALLSSPPASSLPSCEGMETLFIRLPGGPTDLAWSLASVMAPARVWDASGAGCFACWR